MIVVVVNKKEKNEDITWKDKIFFAICGYYMCCCKNSKKNNFLFDIDDYFENNITIEHYLENQLINEKKRIELKNDIKNFNQEKNYAKNNDYFFKNYESKEFEIRIEDIYSEIEKENEVNNKNNENQQKEIQNNENQNNEIQNNNIQINEMEKIDKKDENKKPLIDK